MKPEVVQLNRDARRLLLELHELHVARAGRIAGVIYTPTKVPDGFASMQAFHRAADWLMSKELAQRLTAGAFAITDLGVDVAEDEEELTRLLPVPPEAPSAQPSSDPMAGVYELNEQSRRLLAYLHQWHLAAHGGPFRIGPDDDTFAATDLDVVTYRAAAGRLVTKRLAKYFGSGGGLTITTLGAEVFEDAAALREALPTSAPEPAAAARPVVPAISVDVTFVTDARLRQIVDRDVDELNRARNAGLVKAVVILAGSIAEALLLDVCQRNATRAVAHLVTLKIKRSFPDRMSLIDLVKIAVAAGLVNSAAEKHTEGVCDFRDYVHPHREVREGARLTPATADVMAAVLALVAEGLGHAAEDGRLAAYAEAEDGSSDDQA